MVTHELLLVGLGPVQDFIAAARRCQDLWYGSYLLSELAKVVAASVRREAETDDVLIFPPTAEEKSVANKILARVPAGQAQRIVEAARTAAQEELSRLADEAFDGLPSRDGGFHRDVADAQLAELLEWQWVAVPLDAARVDGYREARARAEDLLSRSKFLRDWSKPSWRQVAGTPKSSIDGMRESVIDESVYKAHRDRPVRLRRVFGVRPGERLCGVGLLKRRGAERILVEDASDEGVEWKSPAFHSTSHVAAAPLLTRIAWDSTAAEAVRAYERTLGSLGIDLGRVRIRSSSQGNKTATVSDPLSPNNATTVTADRTFAQSRSRGLDGVLLFEDRLEEIIEESVGTDPERGLELTQAELQERVNGARKALRAALGAMHQQPCAYYALLLADGDRMGKALDALTAIDQHRAVSTALESFASGCRQTVEDHGGSLIYSGGDDVLALLPLHTVLACARRLSEQFVDALKLTAAYGEAVPAENRPTLSVGVAIAHHLDPLSEVRAQAKAAEKLAKRERNSLAIVLQKRSGGRLELVDRWTASLDHRLWQWVSLLNSEELPDSAAFELERAVATFDDAGLNAGPRAAYPPGSSEGRAMLALARRALGRRRAQLGRTELAPGVSDFIERRLAQIESNSEANVLAGIQSLSEEMQVAREFQRAWQVAWSGFPGRGEA